MRFLFNKRIKSLVLITLLSSFVHLGNGNEQKPELSQTVPPDMVYIKGNDSIHSFYISVTEEPNINWRIYTDWLKKVYVDYPEIYEQALPLNKLELTKNQYNDPIIENYTNHPAYDYYPVTGVSWRQIQNFLSWKTDRLNEMILVKSKITEFDSSQINYNNFNTEAYLEHQYGAKIIDKEIIEAYKKGKYRNINSSYNPTEFILNNGIMVPHYRLPTEAEWDCANIYSKMEVNSKKAYSIYGVNYFLKNWDKNAIKNETPQKQESYPKTNTMESGVEEWLMDMEGFEHKSGYGSFDIYYKNGFDKFGTIENHGAIFDTDGMIDMKDKLGQFSFIFCDYDNMNSPLYVIRRGAFDYNNYDTTVENPFYQNEELFEKHKNSFYTKVFGRFTFSSQISYMWKRQLITNKTLNLYTSILKENVYKNRKIKSGNYKNPGRQTYLLNENEASELTGFRCVIPVTSVAVNPKYKVKWE